jgi:hypothetical protein
LTGAVTLKGLSDEQIREYLAEMPVLWEALTADDDLRDLARTPLLLALLTRAYQHNASELRALSDLKIAPARLRDKIFDAYVRSRFDHEQRRANAELPFSIDDAYQILGAAAIDGVEYYEAGHVTHGDILEKSLMKRLAERAAPFVEQMLRLNLLVREHAQGLIFIHALLRDHFGIRYALEFQNSPEFKLTRGFPMRALQLLGPSGDERALEPLLRHVESYVVFPLTYSFRFPDPRVLLAYARSLSIDIGDPRYDTVSDAAADSIKIVARQLGTSASALALSSAIESAPPKERADYVFALGFIELAEGFDAAIAATQDHDPTVRGCAIYALAAIGRAEAAPAVERLLSDEQEVRHWIGGPWRWRARVKHIAKAALLGTDGLEHEVFSYFPSKLRQNFVLQ